MVSKADETGHDAPKDLLGEKKRSSGTTVAVVVIAIVVGVLLISQIAKDHGGSSVQSGVGLGGGSGLVEQTYDNNSFASTQIQSCSQANGVVNITATTKASDVGTVSVTLYALAGQGKYDNKRVVSLGDVSASGDDQWTLGVGDSNAAWGCGVSTYLAAPIGPSFPP